MNRIFILSIMILGCSSEFSSVPNNETTEGKSDAGTSPQESGAKIVASPAPPDTSFPKTSTPENTCSQIGKSYLVNYYRINGACSNLEQQYIAGPYKHSMGDEVVDKFNPCYTENKATCSFSSKNCFLGLNENNCKVSYDETITFKDNSAFGKGSLSQTESCDDGSTCSSQYLVTYTQL
jgi:hypothetical protein